MGTDEQSNEGADTVTNDPEVIRAVRELAAPPDASTLDTGVALVRRALEMLDSVSHLLTALSPPEIQAATSRVYLGRLDDADAVWRMYANRHRVLSEVFETLHSSFAQRAREHMSGRSRSGPERAP